MKKKYIYLYAQCFGSFLPYINEMKVQFNPIQIPSRTIETEYFWRNCTKTENNSNILCANKCVLFYFQFIYFFVSLKRIECIYIIKLNKLKHIHM